MCLWTVKEKYDKPKEIIGFKVMLKNPKKKGAFNFLYKFVTHPKGCELDKPLVCHNQQNLADYEYEPYQTGFHVYKSYAEADLAFSQRFCDPILYDCKKSLCIVRVKLNFVHTRGVEFFTRSVEFFTEELKVLTKNAENKWKDTWVDVYVGKKLTVLKVVKEVIKGVETINAN